MLSDLDKLYHRSTGKVQTRKSSAKLIKAKILVLMTPSVILQDACGQVTSHIIIYYVLIITEISN